MKHNKNALFLLFVVILTPLSSISQQYQPLPDSNASWIIEQDDGFGGLWYNKFSLSPFLDDTVINSKNYIKVYFRFDIGDSEYFGAFRNAENGKAYFIKRFSNNEYLLRDFSKNTGDTIYNVDYELDLEIQLILDFIVDSTDVTNSGPYTYKIMYLSTVVEDTVPEQGDLPLV